MRRQLTGCTIAILLATAMAGCYSSRYDRDPYYDGDYRSRSTYRDTTTDRPVQQGIREGIREGVRDAVD